ncbi:polypeptide N-acetylgalactosaminyltransferase 17-like isoform X2 [Nerophis ophidion]|uniref:polypeptide N-acetylgalactosaminyltransferase 17-like isoform X2 n=1 Tax=Nerophis ophidion TaxID=159077 RepID=UPI002AE0313E|nr:polypeptide N-acetylgalactosaminyltransferase 17-like isoform X2 [Nerophis ophidion]
MLITPKQHLESPVHQVYFIRTLLCSVPGDLLMAVLVRRWKRLLLINAVALVAVLTVWTIICTYNFQIILHPQLKDTVLGLNKDLSKQLGLIEGKGTDTNLPHLTSDEENVAQNLSLKYGYNVYLSDKISLDRTIMGFKPNGCQELTYPSNLPQMSLIFIFVNEALSVILRSVHSAINHTPPHLLKEIILVDDQSDDEQLKGPLEKYMKIRYNGLVKFVRNQRREGLIRARLEGWKVATGEVTGFFDAHMEFTPNWAEPVLARIKEDRTRIVLPAIDNIHHQTFEVERFINLAHGFDWQLWCMYMKAPKDWNDLKDPTAPIRSPSMIGCSFVVDRVYFEELGLFDAGMNIYGGENVELGIRVWTCGGSMEVLPCSRVAHIARYKKPYLTDDIYAIMRRNALRVAEVWMDEFKHNVYMAWNIPMKNHGIDYGDVSDRVALRKKLQCKDFKWYQENIYPELKNYIDTITYGEMRNSKAKHLCLDQGVRENYTAILFQCHGLTPQLVRFTTKGQLMLGALGFHNWYALCLVDDRQSFLPRLLPCNKVTEVLTSLWLYTPNGRVRNAGTGRCLEVVSTGTDPFFKVVMQNCSGQMWSISPVHVQP